MKFSSEIDTFIRENALGKRNKELTELINKIFNTNYSVKRVKNRKEYLKVKSINQNFIYNTKTKELGAEHINSKGFVTVKVAPRIWRNKQLLVYEAAYGEIPKNCQIIHLDGNKLNNRLENLYCIDRSEMAYLNQIGGLVENLEINKTKLNLVKLRQAINNRREK